MAPAPAIMPPPLTSNMCPGRGGINPGVVSVWGQDAIWGEGQHRDSDTITSSLSMRLTKIPFAVVALPITALGELEHALVESGRRPRRCSIFRQLGLVVWTHTTMVSTHKVRLRAAAGPQLGIELTGQTPAPSRTHRAAPPAPWHQGTHGGPRRRRPSSRPRRG